MTDVATVEPQGSVALASLEQTGVVHGVGLHLPPGLPYDQYEAIGRMLWLEHQKIQFLMGDWLNYGEDEYEKDVWAQAAHMTGAADNTLINWKSIAKRVPPQRRRMDVNHTIHGVVASLPPEDQKRILRQAAEERLTKMQVVDLAREAQGKTNHDQHVLEQERCPECGRPLP